MNVLNKNEPHWSYHKWGRSGSLLTVTQHLQIGITGFLLLAVNFDESDGKSV